MNIDEYVSFLDSPVRKVTPLYLDLDFDVNKLFDKKIDLQSSKEERSSKQGRTTFKEIYETTSYITNVTALHVAVAKNQGSVVKWLLENNNPDTSVKCDFHEHVSQEVLKKMSGKHGPFLGSSDFTGKHMISHTHGKYTALELAEKLGNDDCADILKTSSLKPAAAAASHAPSSSSSSAAAAASSSLSSSAAEKKKKKKSPSLAAAAAATVEEGDDGATDVAVAEAASHEQKVAAPTTTAPDATLFKPVRETSLPPVTGSNPDASSSAAPAPADTTDGTGRSLSPFDPND